MYQGICFTVFCVSYGRITCGTTANSGGVTIGATVTYTPNSNAQLVGASKITCMPNGSWSAPTPMCRRKYNNYNIEHFDVYVHEGIIYTSIA